MSVHPSSSSIRREVLGPGADQTVEGGGLTGVLYSFSDAAFEERRIV